MAINLSVLEEELASVDSELQALEIQVQELLERQQELIQKKTVLKRKIEEFADTGSGSSKEAELAAEEWNKEDFPWSQKIRSALLQHFKLKKFRSLQLETINATMAGRDVFLVMPTGGGKSLCYQLPATCSDGFTLVICPLISLMEDQLMVLEQLGISAALLNASSSKEHVKWVHGEMLAQNSHLKLIYVTPEKIAKSKLFMARLEKAYQAGRLTRIAVDEVHCCSQWGHDFRPDYKLLGILKRQFPNAPLMGLTATATNHVLQDAQKILCVQNCITFTASFNRPNLYYEVRQKPSNAQNFVEDIVKLINGRYKGLSGIIYCFSQKDAMEVAMNLQKLGIKAGTYHANLEPEYKSKVHKRWSSNEIQVVVATVAFGMGIDKPDVRFVIHHSMSKSMENYYQESGRAGRDDQKADCILYYSFWDMFRISTMVVMENVGQQKLYDMVSYCLSQSSGCVVDCRLKEPPELCDQVFPAVGPQKLYFHHHLCSSSPAAMAERMIIQQLLGTQGWKPLRCRRVLIAYHFDEAWDSASCSRMCDNCCRTESFEKMDVTEYCRDLLKILDQVDQMREKFTPLKLIDAWLGKGLSKLGVEVAAPKLSRDALERIIAHLILQKYLKEDFSFTAYTTISYVKRGPKANLLKNKSHAIKMEGILSKNSNAKIKSPLSSPGSSVQKKMELTHKKRQGKHKLPCPENYSQAKKGKIETDKAEDDDESILIED